jgi:hypothetical protein
MNRERYLECLATSPAYRAVSTPLDDEPVTAGDSEAIERATTEVRTGPVVSHDTILREFNLR